MWLFALTSCGLGPLTSEELFGLAPVPKAWLLGTVYDTQTGAPLEGVAIDSTTTDTRGTYRLDVTAGHFNGLAVKAGYMPFSLEREVHAGANRLDIALSPLACGGCGADEVCDSASSQCVLSATLSSDVVSACTGGPISARVTVSGHSLCSGQTKGYFQLQHLTPGGPQTLAVGKGGYAVFSTSLSLVSGFNTLEPIRLTPLGGCSGTAPVDEPCVCNEPGCQ